MQSKAECLGDTWVVLIHLKIVENSAPAAWFERVTSRPPLPFPVVVVGVFCIVTVTTVAYAAAACTIFVSYNTVVPTKKIPLFNFNSSIFQLTFLARWLGFVFLSCHFPCPSSPFPL